ncbi:MAG: hypothetical protein HY749_15905 [Gammaproteobacteria bacterium]|nr:hypothetical protein [Gammaproteobacteria bacterium]
MTIQIASRDATGLMALSIDPPAGTDVRVTSVFNPLGTPAAGMAVAELEVLPGVDRSLVLRSITQALVQCLRVEAGHVRIGRWEVPVYGESIRATLKLALAGGA